MAMTKTYRTKRYSQTPAGGLPGVGRLATPAAPVAAPVSPYQSALGSLGASTQQAQTDIWSQLRSLGNSNMASLVGRGLSATTMLPSLAMGVGRYATDAYGRIVDAQNAQRAGIYSQMAQDELQRKSLGQQRYLANKQLNAQAMAEMNRNALAIAQMNNQSAYRYTPTHTGWSGQVNPGTGSGRYLDSVARIRAKHGTNRSLFG